MVRRLTCSRSDQANTQVAVDRNHTEVLKTLDDLRQRLDASNELLRQLQADRVGKPANADNSVAGEAPTVDQDAIESLQSSIKIGEDLHERYTSEWTPDDRSLRFNRGLASEEGREFSTEAAASEPQDSERVSPESSEESASVQSGDTLTDEKDDKNEHEPQFDSYPLEVLDRYIEAAIDYASTSKDQQHFNQAESNFQSAIKYSEDRERQHGVPFTNRIWLEEEVAQMYQKQGKFADAVARLHRLLSEANDDWTKARQNHLLASVYFERHESPHQQGLNLSSEDIEKAEGHAQTAFSKQFELLKTRPANSVSEEEAERYIECTELLVKILETRGKTVEANVMKTTISEGTPSLASDSIRRVSTLRGESENALVGDRHQLLITALKPVMLNRLRAFFREEISTSRSVATRASSHSFMLSDPATKPLSTSCSTPRLVPMLMPSTREA